MTFGAIPPTTPGTSMPTSASTGRPAWSTQGACERTVAVQSLKDLLEVRRRSGEVGLVRVGWRAWWDVLVDWGRLVVPGDADAAALGEDGAEVHAQDAADAGLGDQTGLADGCTLLRHDHLEHQLVADLGAVACLEVAAVLGVLAKVVLELQLDARVGRTGVVGLPSGEEGLLTDGAGLGAGDAPLAHLFLLLLGGALDLGHVLLAGGCDCLHGLLEAPCELLQLPVLDGVGSRVDLCNTVEAHGEGVRADGVDDLLVVHAGLDVGRRENADRVVRELWWRE